MRVLICGTSFNEEYGGPALTVSRLADALSKASAYVGVWSPDQSVERSGVFPAASAVVKLTGSVENALKQFPDPDIVHDNGLWLAHNHHIARLARQRRIPRIVSTRGMLEPWALRHKRWRKTLAWALYQHRDLATAAELHVTSEQEHQNLGQAIKHSSVAMIPNGVDLPPLNVDRSGASPSVRIALFVGRLHPVKNLPLLLQAWARLEPAGWILKILGPGDPAYRNELCQMVSSLGLSSSVLVGAPVSGSVKLEAFRSASLFILPSHSESFGLAVAEALAHGLPVLTTTNVPWPDLEARQCGWRVAPRIPDFVDGIKRAVCCPVEELTAMGSRGRAWMESEFSWSDVAKRMLVRYEAIIQSAAPGRNSSAK